MYQCYYGALRCVLGDYFNVIHYIVSSAYCNMSYFNILLQRMTKCFIVLFPIVSALHYISLCDVYVVVFFFYSLCCIGELHIIVFHPLCVLYCFTLYIFLSIIIRCPILYCNIPSCIVFWISMCVIL